MNEEADEDDGDYRKTVNVQFDADIDTYADVDARSNDKTDPLCKFYHILILQKCVFRILLSI